MKNTRYSFCTEFIYFWVPAVSFIAMMSSSWRHLHCERSQLVRYFTHQYSFTTRQVLNSIEQVYQAFSIPF